MIQYQFVGVDVAKDKFDVALQVNNSKHLKCFSNDQKGRQSFLQWLNEHTQNSWVCMEATGHYSELIADFLYQQNIRVSVVNPLQIKSYTRAKLSRNKTDQIDAQIIRDYCEKMQPRTFTPRSPEHKELKDLLNLFDMLKVQYTQLNNQLHTAQSSLAQVAIRKLIKTMEKEIIKVEKKMGAIVKDHSSLNQNMNLMTSIKGVGQQTAFKILAHAPDISCFANAKQFAAYMGITPRSHQSGKFVGKTTISRMGSSRLRKILYMAALSAKRFNQDLQPFIKRLESKGKANKLILCAVMRKLAHLIYGILKNKTSFDPNYL